MRRYERGRPCETKPILGGMGKWTGVADYGTVDEIGGYAGPPLDN